MNFSFVVRALYHRNYRIFFMGQTVSLVGTWMQQVAQGWLVYRLTGSALWLGVVGFAGQIPTFLISPFAGAVADRWNRRKILLITQWLGMLQALILAGLVLGGIVHVWHILVLGFSLGVVYAFDIPARQAFLIEMIDKQEDLGNAIALNSSMFHGARLIGPSLAGLLIATSGEGICFLINALSYIAVIAALLALRAGTLNQESSSKPILRGIREGFAYAFGLAPLRSILLLLSLLSLMGMSYAVLMPVFAKNVLHGNAQTLGFLVGASGMGSLTGAVFLASRRDVRGLGRIIVLAAAVFGIGLVAFSFSRVLWVSLVLMFLMGFGMMVEMASCNTVLQTLVDDDKRGRVMGLYAMSIMGMLPFGSLIMGGLAGKIGAPQTLLIGGLCSLGGALIFALHLPAWREMVRPIYRQKGIIPELAQGIQEAARLAIPPED